MLITDKDILPRFLEHLSWATEIDLATAWATSHPGLRALQRQVPTPEVRAVVGLWGNLTDPFALRMLSNIGQLHGAGRRSALSPESLHISRCRQSGRLGRKREFHLWRFRHERRGTVRNIGH